MVSFKTSFEGRERQVATDCEKERIPRLLSREKECLTIMWFSFEGKDAKSVMIGSELLDFNILSTTMG